MWLNWLLITGLISFSLCQAVDIIITIAGNGTGSYSGDNSMATSATINGPTGIAIDSTGNVFFNDAGNNRVRKITVSTGIISTYAGIGSATFSGDNGVASSAALNLPIGLCIDSSGNVYVSDSSNHRIRKITALTSIIQTIAGTGTASYNGDNIQATSSALNYPYGVAVDASGNVYIGDYGNQRIRKVSVTTNVITTIAGTGTAGSSGNGGQASAANIHNPTGITLDNAGNVYFGCKSCDNVIRKITVSTGIISVVAGFGSTSGGYNGDNIQATSATLSSPYDVVLDNSDNLYISDFANNRIRKVTVSTGLITTIVGNGATSYSGDGGAATAAALYNPQGVAVDTSGNLYIADSTNRLRKILFSTTSFPSLSPSLIPSTVPTTIKLSSSTPIVTQTSASNVGASSPGIISTLIGYCSGDDGPATNANIILPTSVVLDSSGSMYIGSFYDYKIRKVTSTGTISSIVGSGIGTGTSGSVDGSGTSAKVNIVYGLALDSSNNVYIADTGNSKIRKLTVSTGIVSTYACIGVSTTYSNNVAATSTGCYYTYAVALDSSNNVYIGDTYHNQVRKVTASTGIIAAFAGTGTTTGAATGSFGGDNGQATAAQLYRPSALALDSSGNVYISDTLNFRIRKVTISTGVITTIAGTGTANYNGDNIAATSASLNELYGVTLDASGNVYIADFGNHRIRKVTISTGVITTIAGTGSGTYTGDGGSATSATVANPVGVYYYSSSSSLYIGDFSNRVVRKISSTGIISTVAGHTYDTTQATSLALSLPEGVAVDSSGNVYVSEYSGHKVKKMTVSTGLVSDIAGIGSTSSNGDGAAATSAGIYSPSGLAVDASGNVYIAETLGYRIRKLTVSTGIISTVVGTGSTGSCTSGSAATSTTCKVNSPMAVEVDSSGNVYYSDTLNYKVMKYTASTGIVTTVAGSGSFSTGGDGGAATSAGINKPYGFVFDASGNIIISEYASHKVRKVTVATGFISTIAGTGTSSYSGDGGSATSAALYNPTDVAIDSYGDIYISDSGNNMIRKITVSTGIISTIAGSSTSGSYTGNNVQATTATFNTPFAIAIDSANNIYITDATNGAVRNIDGVASLPTFNPTVMPTAKPTITPTITPTVTPTAKPTVTPSGLPTLKPSQSASPTSYGVTYLGSGDCRRSSSLGGIDFSNTVNYTVTQPTLSSCLLVCANTPNCNAVMYTESCNCCHPANQCYLYTGGTYTATNGVSCAPCYSVTAVSPTSIPSRPPTSLQPSSIPTTMTPSYIPTMSPSAYPTYTSNVHVYFMVTQVLSGITAATYSNNKVSNDALFKQTVVSMLGYDCRLEDVTIQQVSDYSSATSRSLSLVATAVDTELIYSVTTPTRIFNDANTATALFIQALNESIATGAFDALLRTSGNADWLSASTAYTIFSTASPTSSPTSTPTSAPTKRDNVAVNLLNAPLTADVAKAKINYYLGAFVGYFLSIYVCLYLYSFLRYGRATATRLYDTSYQSDAYVNNSAAATSESVILFDLRMKNELVVRTRLLEEELVSVKAVTRRSGRESTNTSAKNSLYSISVSEKLDNIFTTEDENKYSNGYREYMYQQRTLLGCSPFLYPEGYAVKIPCVSREVVLPPGRMEDLLLYICHNHPLFTCFYFMDGSKLGAHGTRILYIGKDMAVFVLYQFSNTLLQYYMLDGHGFGTLINLFVITPSAVSVGLILKYLYTCPFTETVEFQRKYAKYQSTVIFLGRLAIIPIMVIMFSSLIMACIFSSNRDVPMILVNYFVYVQFYGIVLAIAQAVLLFIDGYYYKLSLFGVLDVLCIGQLFKERILAEQLVVEADYAYRIRTYLFGLIKVQKILNRDDAIKAKWIKVISDDTVDIEMTGAADSDDGIVVRNPLSAKAASRRESASFTFDAIHSSNNDEEVGNYSTLEGDVSSEPVVVVSTENPIQASIRSESSEADDDAALYLEYQSSQHSNRQDDSVYDTANDEKEITFEEWKNIRKCFKQGTRSWFLKAFQVFEEREQLFTSDSSKVSASVANTMHLQANFKVKNVLATRSTPAAAKHNNG